MFLPLAEKKILKFAEEGKITAEAEVDLYLMILERQHKYQDIINVIEGPLGEHLSNHLDFLTRRKGQLLVKLNRWKEAFELYRSLIENNPDQLEYYAEWFNVAFALDDQTTNEAKDGKLYIGQVVELLRQFSDRGVSDAIFAKLRGPYIARTHLFHLLQEKESSSPQLKILKLSIGESRVNLLLELFKNFGNKNCCYHDICYVLSKFSHEPLQDVPSVRHCKIIRFSSFNVVLFCSFWIPSPRFLILRFFQRTWTTCIAIITIAFCATWTI